MITEDYVSFEIAKLLKEKGFDIPVRFEHHCIYNVNQKPQFHRKPHNFNGVEYSGLTSKWYSAPSQSLALKWLREVHKINIVIGVAADDDNLYSLWKFDIWNGNYSIIWGNKREKFNSYEQAVEAALKYTLKNLI